MKLPGERICSNCGRQWSYYETATITCPNCDSKKSTSAGPRREHTTGNVSFDLTSVRANVDDQSLQETAKAAADTAATYLRSIGFVAAGELQPLDEQSLAAAELRRVGATVGRRMNLTADEKEYLYTLLEGADTGDRPDAETVPDQFSPDRVLGVARILDIYETDLRRVSPSESPELDRVCGSLRTHRKRLEALDGNIDPSAAETLVRATREVGTYVRTGDQRALARGRDHLDSNL